MDIFAGLTASGEFWPVIILFELCATLGGVYIILHAIINLKDYGLHGDYAKHGWMSCLLQMAVGILLIDSFQTLGMFTETFFGNDLTTSSSFPNGNPLGFGGGPANAIQKAQHFYSKILGFIQAVGVLSFLRGLFVWHESTLGYKNSGLWKGLFHVVGGLLAFHFSSIQIFVISFLSSLSTF